MIDLSSITIDSYNLYKVITPRSKRSVEIFRSPLEAASALRSNPSNRLIVSLWSARGDNYYGSIEITEIARLLSKAGQE